MFVFTLLHYLIKTGILSPVSVVCLAVILLSLWFLRNNKERSKLDKLIKLKGKDRNAELNRLSVKYKAGGGTNEHKSREILILSLQWNQLIDALQTGKLTATQVLEAYMSKAVASTELFNSVTEFIPQAAEWAKELDALDKPKGPLHGVPFCVKDDQHVEGMDTTIGLAKNLFKPQKDTAVLVKVLKDLGAVPFCKTNVPQTMFTYGSDNPVFGATLNATNPKLSPGGSSSGTGSLVGAHGAWFGTGGDIGGSLRIPAHFNGVATIKPTAGRISSAGLGKPIPDRIGIQSVPGVIGRNATVVSTVFKGITEGCPQYKYDCQTAPIPWNEAIFKSKEKLRIGYFTNLPFFPLMGDTEEVVLEAKATLESLGHTLVPVTNMPDGYDYISTTFRFLNADNYGTLRKLWKGERIAKSMQLTYMSSCLPLWVQRVISKFIAGFSSFLLPSLHSKRTAVLVGAGAKDCKELWEAEGNKKRIVKEILDEWKDKKLNAVVCPVFPFPAPPLDLPGMLPVAVVYSMIWNLVDFPAGVVPFGEESGKKIEQYDCEGDSALRLAKKGIKESIGAPIGVQIVARPYNEEVILRVMCELEPFSKKNSSYLSSE